MIKEVIALFILRRSCMQSPLPDILFHMFRYGSAANFRIMIHTDNYKTIRGVLFMLVSEKVITVLLKAQKPQPCILLYIEILRRISER